MQSFYFYKIFWKDQKLEFIILKISVKTEIKNTLPFFLENYFGPRGPVRVCFFSGAPRSVPSRFRKKTRGGLSINRPRLVNFISFLSVRLASKSLLAKP